MSETGCPSCGSTEKGVMRFDIIGGDVVVTECTECGYKRANDPDVSHPNSLVERIGFAGCKNCGGTVVLRVWGEGIDSEVWCQNCGEKEIYR